jgi:Ala-tRNA(Pro) deacylase
MEEKKEMDETKDANLAKVVNNEAPAKDAKSKVYALFGKLGIKYRVVEHPPIFTEEDNKKHGIQIDSVIFKNLFLRNKNKSRYYLVSLPLEKKADLAALQARLGETRLSFGSEADLWDKLAITHGSVSLLNVIGVGKTDVIHVIDKTLFDSGTIAVHPNDNTATIIFEPKELARIYEHYGVDFRFSEI